MSVPDPYAMDTVELRYRIRQEFGVAMAITDPRAVVIARFDQGWDLPALRRLVDPALLWARSWGEFFRQLRDVFLHEFWTAAGRSEKSPGWSARYLPDHRSRGAV